MNLIVKVDKKVKLLNTLAACISEYVEQGDIERCKTLDEARRKIMDQITYLKFYGYARGSLAVGKPYVLGRSATKNTGSMAFGISQPGRVCSFITIWETESHELPPAFCGLPHVDRESITNIDTVLP